MLYDFGRLDIGLKWFEGHMQFYVDDVKWRKDLALL